MSEEIRVVLVKPGDVLVIGNIGDHDHGRDAGPLCDLARELADILGIKVVMFEADIDMACVPSYG